MAFGIRKAGRNDGYSLTMPFGQIPGPLGRIGVDLLSDEHNQQPTRGPGDIAPGKGVFCSAVPLGEKEISRSKAKDAPDVPKSATVPAPVAPSTTMPPFVNAGPSSHPALPATGCGAGVFFSVPPTQTTTGFLLSATEVARRRADITAAVAKSKPTRPLASANLEHWLDNTGSIKIMPTAPFTTFGSGLIDFLFDKARPKFEKAVIERLKNPSHPQGSLLPIGTVRFIQYRDDPRPLMSGPGFAPDLAIAVGAYLIHSAIWVKVTSATTSGFIFKDTTYTVEILRWCVQVMDTYDWNVGAITQMLVPKSELANLALPPEAITVGPELPATGEVVVTLHDTYFRNLEVSSGGKAFLVYTEPFDAPSSKGLRNPFVVKL